MEGIRKIHLKHKNIKEASPAWGDFLCAPRESPHALPTAAGSCKPPYSLRAEATSYVGAYPWSPAPRQARRK